MSLARVDDNVPENCGHIIEKRGRVFISRVDTIQIVFLNQIL
jgi:hypothetical protein